VSFFFTEAENKDDTGKRQHCQNTATCRERKGHAKIGMDSKKDNQPGLSRQAVAGVTREKRGKQTGGKEGPLVGKDEGLFCGISRQKKRESCFPPGVRGSSSRFAKGKRLETQTEASGEQLVWKVFAGCQGRGRGRRGGLYALAEKRRSTVPSRSRTERRNTGKRLKSPHDLGLLQKKQTIAGSSSTRGN